MLTFENKNKTTSKSSIAKPNLAILMLRWQLDVGYLSLKYRFRAYSDASNSLSSIKTLSSISLLDFNPVNINSFFSGDTIIYLVNEIGLVEKKSRCSTAVQSNVDVYFRRHQRP